MRFLQTHIPAGVPLVQTSVPGSPVVGQSTVVSRYSAVQCSTVQYNTVHYSTVQCIAVQYSAVQYSTVQYSTVQSN